MASPAARPAGRRARSALALAATLIACGGGSVVPFYGAPPMDAGEGDVDYGQPLYGGGWVDAGGDASDGSSDATREADAPTDARSEAADGSSD